MKIKILTAFLIICLNSCSDPSKKEDFPPNILFILADDQRNDVLGCAGHPIVQTPTIDQLAEKGIRFTNAFVTTSICAASRASILTGLYESKHDYTFGKDPLKKEYVKQSYPYRLRKEGYITGFVGKLGVNMEAQDSLLQQMFDYYKLSPRNAPYFEQQPDGSRRHSAEIKGDQAIEFIRQQSSHQPFCLSISFNAVHAVDNNLKPGNEGHYPYPASVGSLYEGMEMPLPKWSDPDAFDQHPEFLKNSLNRVRYHWRWDTDYKYQVNMKAYLRMISGYDRVVQRVLEALKAKALDKNTVVIFSADNGYYMGDRGFAGKWSHYEESLRVPLIIYDPRTSMPSNYSTSDKMVLNIDIPATILDYARSKQPAIYQGQSLVPLTTAAMEPEWRKGFFCEHRMDHPQIPKFIGYRGEHFVYANYYEQEPAFEYLHDLQKDPDQLINFKNHPAYQQILQEMRGRCFETEEKWRQ